MTALRCSLLLLSMLAAASIASASPLRTAALLSEGKQPVRVVCIGDSITGVYYHTGSLRAYPEMLQVALRKLYPNADVTVRNAGISGDTTKGALARLERDVLKHRPTLVTVMFGMNDLVRIPSEEFKGNLAEIARRCRAAGAEVLFCTQNTVVETPQRPVAKLEEFTKAIRDVGQALGVGVVDCHATFAAVAARSKAEWELLLSDSIHPNMDGHKLFATTIAKAISGRDVSLADVPAPEPALRHTFEKLRSGKPVKVLAMPPYDTMIAPALQRAFPDANITTTAWPNEGQTLAQLDRAADQVRKAPLDLVFIAIPASAGVDPSPAPQRHYTWIMNKSLSFGPQQWDVVAALPSVAKSELTADERRVEEAARRLVAANDLHAIARTANGPSSPADLLGRWIDAQYSKWRSLPNP